MSGPILKSVVTGGVLALALALFAGRPGRRNSAPDRTSQSDAQAMLLKRSTPISNGKWSV